jgi:hypothetical protein
VKANELLVGDANALTVQAVNDAKEADKRAREALEKATKQDTAIEQAKAGFSKIQGLTQTVVFLVPDGSATGCMPLQKVDNKGEVVRKNIQLRSEGGVRISLIDCDKGDSSKDGPYTLIKNKTEPANKTQPEGVVNLMWIATEQPGPFYRLNRNYVVTARFAP